MRFSDRELRDLAVAWLALGLAFTFFLDRRIVHAVFGAGIRTLSLDAVGTTFVVSLATVGVAFLLHELAHKVVAVHFDQVAEFRADYGMLLVAVAGGLAGFLFAAPGAVYHRGRITRRESGLIALAGPVTNLGLAVVSLVVLAAGTGPAGAFAARIGSLGLFINLLLAGFNMLPYGPLDGRKVFAWDRTVYVAVAAPSIALGLWVLFGGL
ncbi:MAG: metalloprotease [Haloarculaceae archaeon]